MNQTTDDGQRTVNEIMRSTTATLTPKYGEGEAKAMVRLMFENLKGWTPVDIAIKANEHLTAFMEGKIADVVKRLMSDEPIQYIFNLADFYGMKLIVTPDTLIPRPETAELVDMIVKENNRKDLRVIDLGTGSGCIAIALSRNLPFADVTAVDINPKTLAVAKENAGKLHCNIRFFETDILEMAETHDMALSGPFDIIVSNPRYIAEHEKRDMERNVTDFEPAGALFVPDNDPLMFYNAELQYAQKALARHGRMYFEINPLFADDLKRLCENYGFSDVALTRDSFGKIRFLSATKTVI